MSTYNDEASPPQRNSAGGGMFDIDNDNDYRLTPQPLRLND